MQYQNNSTNHALVKTIDASTDSKKWLKTASNYRPDWVLPTNSYPGLWAKVHNDYFAFIKNVIDALSTPFNYSANNVKRVSCNYALVTQEPSSLQPFQTIPHFDLPKDNQIALVHYLCDAQFGGTGFYSHKSTGINRVSRHNHDDYIHSIKKEIDTHTAQSPQYITHTHPLFVREHYEAAQFGKIVAYPGNLLHSACIPQQLPKANDLRSGRLTITTFATLGEDI
ncbi:MULTISPECIES: DUF6445 family protein [Pseudoalteromonas]|uniref:Uncharacterized protein n=1 Tax=Pseudoalteromonas aurantia 208 TaxID=1314867 RepID=A0ABR9E935_9GAMM|nr:MULTISPECIES: DUF6445 family protein [Pseudoalteromonas]MBE0367496.1 hypothetical protein [Pseudoalteromonas aurantia 208]MBQ4845864.1 hypothetical protein [Pseudoalteromonas sp. MMG005]